MRPNSWRDLGATYVVLEDGTEIVICGRSERAVAICLRISLEIFAFIRWGLGGFVVHNRGIGYDEPREEEGNR